MGRSGLLGANKKINASGMERRVTIKVGIPGWHGISPVHNVSFDWPRAR